MTEKKRCTRLVVHRAHSWTGTYPTKTYVCEGVAEEAQDPAYASNPYYSAPVTPYYEPSTYYGSSSSSCDSSSSSTSDSYSSPSDSGSSSSSCE